MSPASLKIFFDIILQIWQVIKTWWWLPLPFLLWRPFLFLLLFWRRQLFLKELKSIILEVKIPKEVLKPIRAMEVVLEHLWQICYDPPGSWWEKWVEGKMNPSYDFEVVSLGGEPHFYIRFPRAVRDSVEASIYSQYPEAEISEAEDYTKKVPSDIPNKEWDLWGSDYQLFKPNPYPIKTYTEFETEREAMEEKRIDPLAELLEATSKIGQGEQLWIQITAEPITDAEMKIPWTKEGKVLRDELARRTKKEKPGKPIIMDALDILVTGEPPKSAEKEEESVIPVEMKLTPGERDIITAVEKKISKRGFQTNIRFIYLAKREVFFKPKLRLPMSFFSAFVTNNLNALFPWGKTITKIHKSWFLPKNWVYKRRVYLRQRRLFKNYLRRTHALFPRPPKNPSSFILNTEEMASIFHFPGRNVAPAPFMTHIESKKGEAPPGLPTE